MTVFVEGRHAAEHLVSEANGTRSRDTVTLVAGVVYPAGAVLGKVAASGKFTVLDPAANDGSETAAAVLFDSVDATAGDRPGVVHSRDTEVHGAALAWPDGIGAPEKAAALAQLAALGIVAR